MMMNFDDYVDTNMGAAKMLQRRMLKRGIELTDLQVWQYFAWCQNAVFTRMMETGVPQIQTLLQSYATDAAHKAAALFEAGIKGVFPPPITEQRFESLAEFEATVNDMVSKFKSGGVSSETPIEPDTVKHDGYL